MVGTRQEWCGGDVFTLLLERLRQLIDAPWSRDHYLVISNEPGIILNFFEAKKACLRVVSRLGHFQKRLKGGQLCWNMRVLLFEQVFLYDTKRPIQPCEMNA